ncbi:hypothetical protein D3C72_2322400 [compost metagenome]
MIDFIGGAISAQAPVIDQVVVYIQFLADVVQAIGNCAEQAALNHRLGRLCRLCRSG